MDHVTHELHDLWNLDSKSAVHLRGVSWSLECEFGSVAATATTFDHIRFTSSSSLLSLLQNNSTLH
jgi:hypothetical protein